MTDKLFRFDIYNPGSTDLTTGNIDYTLETELAEAPTVLGPIVRPLQGRSEARPWTVSVVDQSTAVTSRLADSSGRMDTLGRLARLRESRAGAAFANVGVGRIADVFLEDVGAYRFTVEDEGFLSRRATIFTKSTNTTVFYPAGPLNQYGPWPATTGADAEVTAIYSNKYYKAALDNSGLLAMADSALSAIKQDGAIDSPYSYKHHVLSTDGGFGELRLRINGTDRKVASFHASSSGVPATWPAYKLKSLEEHVRDNQGIQVWFAASSGAYTTGQALSNCYLHMMGAKPSANTPLHISWKHPAQMLKDIWDGNHSTAGTPLPRYSTAAIQTLLNEPTNEMRFRITGQENMDDWVSANILQPMMWAVFPDSSGVLHVKSLRLPNSTSGVTFTFSGGNLADHPTWAHMGRELVTVLEYQYPYEEWRGRDATPLFRQGLVPPRGSFGPDGIKVENRSTEVAHDKLANLGRQVRQVNFTGFRQTPLPGTYHPLTNERTPTKDETNFDAALTRLSAELFQRYGDGPIQGDLAALSTAEGVEPGDYALLNLETHPNPKTGLRGGTRLIQILSKDQTPAGPNFSYLDAGPNVQPLAAPSVTISTSASDPKHSVDVTVSGLSSQGAGTVFQAQLANSTSTGAPGTTSSLWQDVRSTAAYSGMTSGTWTYSRRAAGTGWWARARATRPGYYAPFPSTWANSTEKKNTASITAPSAIAVSSAASPFANAIATWTNGDVTEATHLYVDDTTSASFGNANFVLSVPPGGYRAEIINLTSGSTYLVGVRHADPYGGFSSADSTTFTMPARPTCPDMLGIAIIAGGA